MDKQDGETTSQPSAEQTPTPAKPEPDKVTVQCANCNTRNEFEVEPATSDFKFLCAGCGSEITWTR